MLQIGKHPSTEHPSNAQYSSISLEVVVVAVDGWYPEPSYCYFEPIWVDTKFVCVLHIAVIHHIATFSVIFVEHESYYSQCEALKYHYPRRFSQYLVSSVSVAAVVVYIDTVFRRLASNSYSVTDRFSTPGTKSHRIQRCAEILPSVSVVDIAVGGYLLYCDSVHVVAFVDLAS